MYAILARLKWYQNRVIRAIITCLRVNQAEMDVALNSTANGNTQGQSGASSTSTRDFNT
jgi:hypothetical protein